MKVYLADNQDITRAGLTYLLSGMDVKDTKYTEDKAEPLPPCALTARRWWCWTIRCSTSTMPTSLSILCQRFPSTWWVLFSDDLSQDFIHQVAITCPTCGIVLKECDMAEIREALRYALTGRRYICQQVMEQMLTPEKKPAVERPNLTKTELEILKDIALGMTSREIATKRFSSLPHHQHPSQEHLPQGSVSTTCRRPRSMR